MKTGIFAVVATLALTGFAAAPAEAHDRYVDVGFDMGPAFVRYRNGYRPVARVHYDYFGPRRHAYRANNRWYGGRDLWHQCYDGHFYRYYDRKHWRKHEKRWRKRNGFRGRAYGPRGRGHGHRHW